MRRSAVLALSIAAVMAGVPQALGTPEPSTTTATKRNGCARLYTRDQFRDFAREKFHERVYSELDRKKVRARAVCQRTDRSQRWAFELRAKMRAARYHRTHRLCGSTTCNGRLVYWMESRRSNSTQGGCLKTLAWHESGWDETNWNNGGSGAYGIGQALPASKMKAYGADYMTSPRTQIRWMMGYVRGRYGTACGALSAWNAKGWY